MTIKPQQTPDDYGNHPIDPKVIAKHVEIDLGGSIIMGVGPCRSGSKAQLYLMGASDYPALDQPINAIFRCLRMEEAPEAVPFSGQTTYFKETWGPYTPGECRLDPVAVLAEATDMDWLRDHLTVVFLPRSPEETWASWESIWSERLQPEALFEHFCLAYEVMGDYYERYREQNISTEVFPYIANKNPAKNYQKLFERLGLNHEPIVEGWSQPERRRLINRRVKEFYEPELFLPEGIREDVKKSDGIFYSSEQRTSIEPDIPHTVHMIYQNLINQSLLSEKKET